MAAVMFSVRSADGTDVHHVKATSTDRGLRFTCTCSDGTEGHHCEHRIALLLGDTSALVEIDEAAVGSLMVMAKGSSLLQAVHMLAQAEAAAAAAEAQLDLDRAKQVAPAVRTLPIKPNHTAREFYSPVIVHPQAQGWPVSGA